MHLDILLVLQLELKILRVLSTNRRSSISGPISSREVPILVMLEACLTDELICLVEYELKTLHHVILRAQLQKPRDAIKSLIINFSDLSDKLSQ